MVTGVKFTSLGMSVPPAPRDANDPLAPLPVRQCRAVIDLLKK
jgi:hypothetical protein